MASEVKLDSVEPVSFPIVEPVPASQGRWHKIQEAAKGAFENIGTGMSSMSGLKIANRVGNEVERAFNILGSIPFICVFTSYVRVVGSKVYLVAALVLLGIGELGKCIPRINHDKFAAISLLGREHVIHAALNGLIGAGEALLASCTLGMGNILLLYPRCLQRFWPQFAHGSLTDQSSPEVA